MENNKEIMMEQKEVRESNRKADKKAIVPFLLIVAASTFCGALVGFFSNKIGALDTQTIGANVLYYLVVATPYIFCVLFVINVYFGIIKLNYIKKDYRLALANMDEDALMEYQDQVEIELNIPISVSSVSMLMDLFFIAVLIVGNTGEISSVFVFASLFLFICNMVVIVVSQQLCVNFEKELNPEKQGSIYDMKFQDKWTGSFDEAEMEVVYKACYAAYKMNSKVYIGLWLFFILTAAVLHTGILPIAIVMILWAVQTITYLVKVIELSKRN